MLGCALLDITILVSGVVREKETFIRTQRVYFSSLCPSSSRSKCYARHVRKPDFDAPADLDVCGALLCHDPSANEAPKGAQIDELAKGDEVISAGGLLGKVSKMGETYLGVEVANGVEIQVQRSSVVLVLPKGTFK